MRTLLILLLSLAAWSQAAFGHAVLVAADPAAGTVLDSAPAAAQLVFNEPVGVSALSLISPSGKPLPLGAVQSDGARLRIALPAMAAQGTYLLTWRVSSADGHPVGGTLDFAVGTPSATPLTPSTAAGPLWRNLAIWTGRLLALVCLIAACGAAVFRASAPSGHEDWVRRLIGIGLVTLFVNLALHGLDLLDAPLGALAAADTWRAALATSYAGSLGLCALALAAAYRALDTGRRLVLRLSAAGSLILLGLSVANSGHAGTAPPQWLSQPAIALHVMAAAAWLGALVPLARILHRRMTTAPGTSQPDHLYGLSRFSHWIAPVVTLLVLSGLVLAFLQLNQPADLWRTPYGWVLATKLALVVALLALAAGNRWRLTVPALAGDTRAARRLAQSIRIEIVLSIIILAVLSLWRFTPPPRSLDTTSAPGHQHQMDSGIKSPLAISNDQVNAWVGRSPDGLTWTIELTSPDDKPLNAQGLTLTLDNPAAALEPLRREAQRLPDGRWRLQLPVLPDVGLWRLTLDILINDFERVTLRAAMVL